MIPLINSLNRKCLTRHQETRQTTIWLFPPCRVSHHEWPWSQPITWRLVWPDFWPLTWPDWRSRSLAGLQPHGGHHGEQLPVATGEVPVEPSSGKWRETGDSGQPELAGWQSQDEETKEVGGDKKKKILVYQKVYSWKYFRHFLSSVIQKRWYRNWHRIFVCHDGCSSLTNVLSFTHDCRMTYLKRWWVFRAHSSSSVWVNHRTVMCEAKNFS